MQNSVISNRITIYHWSKASPVVLCMQNNVNSIVITSLYESQPSFVVFACKTATFESELQVSMDPRTQLSFCAWKTALVPDLTYGYLHLKQRIYHKIASLFGFLTSPVVLCMQNSVISSRNTSLHGSQTSPVFLCMQNNVISISITGLYWSQPSSVVFACKTASFGSEFHFSMSPRLRLLICECKTVCLDPEWRLSIGLSLNLWFCIFKTATLA